MTLPDAFSRLRLALAPALWVLALLGQDVALAVVCAMSIGWLRFRRIGDLHLYSTKVAATAVHLFAIWLLVFARYSVELLDVAAAVVLLAALEAGIVLAIRDSVDERIGSILKKP